MIRGGLEVLERDGLSLGARSLSYAKVFAHLEEEHDVRVVRASVHERIWASHADFRREVVAEAVNHLPTTLLGSHGHQLRAAVADMYARGLDADERIAELARRFAPTMLQSLLTRPGFREAQIVKAMATPFNDPLTAQVLQGPLRERGDAVLATLRQRLAAITAGLGLQPKARLGLDHETAHQFLSVVTTNLFIGTFLDTNAGSDEVTRPLAYRDVAADDAEPWTLLGVGIEAILQLLFEPADSTGPSPADGVPVPPPPDAVTTPDLDAEPGSTRRSREQLRKLVLAAGVEVLWQERMDLRPESLGYTSVFEHIRHKHGITVYRSSVHNRIWASHDEFWLDVLSQGIRSDPNVSKQTVAELLAYTPARNVDGSLNRRQVALDILRVMTTAEAAASRASADFLRRQAIKAALMTEPEIEPITSLRQAIRDSQQERVGLHSAALRDHVLALGFEPRPELGLSQDEALTALVTLVLITAGGAIFDQSAGIDSAAQSFSLRRDDDPERSDDWPAASIAARAYFELLYQEQGSDPAPAG